MVPTGTLSIPFGMNVRPTLPALRMDSASEDLVSDSFTGRSTSLSGARPRRAPTTALALVYAIYSSCAPLSAQTAPYGVHPELPHRSCLGSVSSFIPAKPSCLRDEARIYHLGEHLWSRTVDRALGYDRRQPGLPGGGSLPHPSWCLPWLEGRKGADGGRRLLPWTRRQSLRRSCPAPSD